MYHGGFEAVVVARYPADMSTGKPTSTIFVTTVVDVPRITDAGRAELLAGLEESRAEYAAGDFDVLTPGKLRKEFEAIFANPDISDEELDALLGIERQKPWAIPQARSGVVPG